MTSDDITTPSFALDAAAADNLPPAEAFDSTADLSFSAVQTASAQNLSATGSAIGSATADSLETIGSAIGMAQVGGDFSASFSSTPLVYVKSGDASIRQSYASALVAGGTVDMSQAVAPMVAGREIHIDMGGSLAMVAGEAHVERGWIGVLLSGRTELGDDTRVMIGTRGAAIIGAALLGGFALVAIAGVLGMRRLIDEYPVDFAAWNEKMPWYHG